MVILTFRAPRTKAKVTRTVLRQVLSDANYKTEKLVGGVGPENDEARKIVRLIKRATIGAENYPLSKAALHQDRNAGIDIWDDEGGAPSGPIRRSYRECAARSTSAPQTTLSIKEIPMFTEVSRADVAFRVKKIVAAQLNIPKEELDSDASYMGDLGADSLEVTQIMMLIEDEFWITFPETPVTDLSTVGRTVDFVFAARGRSANTSPLT